MSYEAWGEPDGRPYPSQAERRIRVEEGDFRAFEGRTPCAPRVTMRQCLVCDRYCPGRRTGKQRSVVIDATVVTDKAGRCPMFVLVGAE